MTTHFLVYNALRNATSFRQLASKWGLAEPPASPVVTDRVKNIFHSLDDYGWLQEAWLMHLDSLRQLKRAADGHHAKLLIVMIPQIEQVYEYLRPTAERLDWEYPNKRLITYFAKEGINVLDLLPELRRYANHQPKPELDPKEDLYWPRDKRLNVKGNRVAGLLISQYILEQSWLEIPDKNNRLSDLKLLRTTH